MPRTGRPPTPAIERFELKTVTASGGCIEWSGYLDRDGYGQFRPAGGRASTHVRAHRWAYEDRFGPVPEGMVLDHLCRNRACVNPDHLEPVTPRENTMRGAGPAAINAAKTHCLRGHPYVEGSFYQSGNHRACKKCRQERKV